MVHRLDKASFERVLGGAEELGLLRSNEVAQTLEMLDGDFPFADLMAQASSIHVHVKVDDTEALPYEGLRALRPEGERTTPGYARFAYKGGCNLIYSSYTLAQDDLIEGAVHLSKPFLDHLGVDLRDESPITRLAFEEVPQRAVASGWRTAHQGPPVYCCYAEVGEKNWVYPPEGPLGPRRPIEFAWGSLKVHDSHVGCDLRPIDPAHPLAELADRAVCGADHYVEQ